MNAGAKEKSLFLFFYLNVRFNTLTSDLLGSSITKVKSHSRVRLGITKPI
jgi:hypothetical protein